MKIAIVGAGAIGGILAVRLARSGQDVTVVDRGAHLDAIKAQGLKLVHPDGTEEIADNLKTFGSCAEAGPQELVFLALKANVIEASRRRCARCLTTRPSWCRSRMVCRGGIS